VHNQGLHAAMGRSRRRPDGVAPGGQASEHLSSIKCPPGLSSVGCESSCFFWLRQILASAELGEHFESAADWADETGCIQEDLLCHEECLQELIEHLSLKKFPARRLRKSRDAFAGALSSGGCGDVHSVSTATSAMETQNGMAAEATCHAQAVVETEDFQDMLRDRVCEEVFAQTEAYVEAASETGAEKGEAKVSKSAKKRVRKQIRDAACATIESAKPQHRLDSCRATNPSLQQSLQVSSSAAVPKQNMFTEALLAVAESRWSERREGCKARAELVIPSKCVGWVIGKNGSTIRYIEQTYLVTAQLVSQMVSVYGKQERVRQAMSYIDQLLWNGLQ